MTIQDLKKMGFKNEDKFEMYDIGGNYSYKIDRFLKLVVYHDDEELREVLFVMKFEAEISDCGIEFKAKGSQDSMLLKVENFNTIEKLTNFLKFFN